MNLAKNSFKSKLHDLAIRSTAHGLSRILVSSSNLTRLVWTICFLLSISGCSYFIMLSFTEYFAFNVTSKLSVRNRSPLLFPAVTFCNSNPFINGISRSLALRFSNFTGFFSFLQRYNYVKSPEFGDENRKALGLTINETLPNRLFNLGEIDVNRFEWYFDYEFGNCYKFNTGFNSSGHPIPLSYSITPGLLSGLRVLLFLGIDRSTSQTRGFSNRGMHILIRDQSDPQVKALGINIQPGVVTNVVISKTITKNIPKPYSNCQDLKDYKSELYDLTIKSDGNYHQRTCFDVCMQKLVNTKCNCNQMNYPVFSNLSTCIEDHQIMCVTNSTTDRSEEIKKYCLKSCPLECESVDYQYSSSFLELTSEYIMFRARDVLTKYNLMSLPSQELKNYFAVVNVYYDELKTTMIEESPTMNIVLLVSNIGGTLGLFLGMSLLSFVEILEVFLELVYNLKNRSSSSVQSF